MGVEKNSIFAIAFEEKGRVLDPNFDVGPTNETAVAQMDVHVALGRGVPTDHRLLIPHQELKLLAPYFGKGRRGWCSD